MKRVYLLLILLLPLHILLTSCKNSELTKQPPITIKVNGKSLNLKNEDASTDTLLKRKIDEDVDFEKEKSIFFPLLQDEKNRVYVSIGDSLEITFEKLPDSAVLYDHLLTKDGTSYFNRSINEQELKLNKTIDIEIVEHSSTYLSSDSNFLSDGSIRGFRLVTKTGDNTSEYSFVIFIKK